MLTYACSGSSCLTLQRRGFVTGTASLPVYDGTSFAKNQDVVFVSFNYRTNVFGFPTASDLPSSGNNLGFLDQELVLAWVQDNIAQFGGDKCKVTIMVSAVPRDGCQLDLHIFVLVGRVRWIWIRLTRYHSPEFVCKATIPCGNHDVRPGGFHTSQTQLFEFRRTRNGDGVYTATRRTAAGVHAQCPCPHHKYIHKWAGRFWFYSGSRQVRGRIRPSEEALILIFHNLWGLVA
jgi:hypothetical protein